MIGRELIACRRRKEKTGDIRTGRRWGGLTGTYGGGGSKDCCTTRTRSHILRSGSSSAGWGLPKAHRYLNNWGSGGCRKSSSSVIFSISWVAVGGQSPVPYHTATIQSTNFSQFRASLSNLITSIARESKATKQCAANTILTRKLQ